MTERELFEAIRTAIEESRQTRLDALYQLFPQYDDRISKAGQDAAHAKRGRKRKAKAQTAAEPDQAKRGRKPAMKTCAACTMPFKESEMVETEGDSGKEYFCGDCYEKENNP